MLIAIASDDGVHVSGHLGLCRRFLIWEVLPAELPRELHRIELPATQTLHAHGQGDHALDGVQLLVATSAGAPLVARLAARGLEVWITPQRDPAQAVRQWLQARESGLPPCVPRADEGARPRVRVGRAAPEGGCGGACGHRR